MSISADDFRAALGRFATGVTILTTKDGAGDHGMTVNAFASVSLDPPLVLACIANNAAMYPVLKQATAFALSVLTTGQEPLSVRFADDHDNRFDGVPHSRSATGLILIDGAHAHLECRKIAWHEAGDHGVCIGQVERTAIGAGEPLIYYRGGYTRMAR